MAPVRCGVGEKTEVITPESYLSLLHCTIKKLFATCDLPCISEGATLAFKDKGHGDDFACMWEIIMALLRSEWFLACATACVWQDDDGAPENILVKAGKVQGVV